MYHPPVIGRRAGLGVIVFVAIVALGNTWHGSKDAIERLALTRALLFEGSVTTAAYGPIKSAPLQSVVMMPSYALGYAARAAIGGTEEEKHFVAYRVTSVLYAPVITALIAVIFLELLLHLGLSARTATHSMFVLVAGTLLLPYSRIMFSEILSALIVLAACSVIVADEGGTRRAIQAVALLGLLCLNAPVFVPLYVFVIAGWTIIRARSLGRADAIRVAAIGAAGLAIVFAVWAAYNLARYGDATNTGYREEGFTTPILTGLYGLTLSIGRGIVIYSLPTVLGLAGLVALRNRLGPAQGPLLLFAVASTAYLLLFSAWSMFEGGWAWGPRFLLTFVPVLHVGFALLIDRATRWGPLARGALYTAAALAILLNGYEFLGVYGEYEGRLDPGDRAAYLRTVFDPASSYLAHNWSTRAFWSRFPQFAAVITALWFALAALERRAPVARI